MSSESFEILKWSVTTFIAAVGAIVSFYIIDLGKLKLEQFRATAENQRLLLDAYLKATESPQPEIWKRKLHVLANFSADERIQAWARAEQEFIARFSEQNALYRETLKVASQLIDPAEINNPERARARARFEQLYWADLPFAKESPLVIDAMIAFRKQLILAESKLPDNEEWRGMNSRLITLASALRDSMPKFPDIVTAPPK